MEGAATSLPDWQDDITSRFESAYKGIALLMRNTPLPIWLVVAVVVLAWLAYGCAEDESETSLLPMTTADCKVQFIHPFRHASLPASSRPSPLALGAGKLASVCDYMVSPRTVMRPGQASRSPSPTGSSPSSSASSSPLGSPRFPCSDPRCCGPYAYAAGGRSEYISSSQRYGSGRDAGGRQQQKQTRRGNGRKGSWRCGLHAVQERDEETMVEVLA